MTLANRQKKIQEKRKKTPWRQFVKEVCSRKSMTFFKRDWYISIFPDQQKRVKNIVSPLTFEKQRWDLYVETKKDEDFFTTFARLLSTAHLPWVTDYGGNENAGYCDCVYGVKNAYLTSITGGGCENVAYSFDVRYTTSNVFQSVFVNNNSDIVYYCLWVTNSFSVFYSRYITDSNHIWFSTNLIWCDHCLFCDDLQNQSYCIKNVQYTKEQYEEKFNAMKENPSLYTGHFAPLIHVAWNNIGSTWTVVWSHIVQSKDIENGYSVVTTHAWRNIVLWGSPHGDEDYYDAFIVWRAKHFYGLAVWWWFSEHCYICSYIWWGSFSLYYCYFMDGCSYCLGCVGLKNKQFCIFNKQYTKEERHVKVDTIFAGMESTSHPNPSLAKQGENSLGAFFPWWMNPFYFNDTAAYLIDDSFTKEELEAEWYLRRDEEVKIDIPEDVALIAIADLDAYEGWMIDGVFHPISEDVSEGQSFVKATRYIDPTILQKVIRDEQGNIYRIVKMEYDFLVKHGLPLPRKHWLERLKMNFKLR